MQSLFLLILTIIEICVTIFLVIKLTDLEKKVDEIHEKFLLMAKEVLVINDKIRETIKKINKVLTFITNKNIYRFIDVMKIIFNTVQIFLLIRSFDFKKKGGIFNYKNLKKLFVSEVARRFLRKIVLTGAELV